MKRSRSVALSHIASRDYASNVRQAQDNFCVSSSFIRHPEDAKHLWLTFARIFKRGKNVKSDCQTHLAILFFFIVLYSFSTPSIYSPLFLHSLVLLSHFLSHCPSTAFELSVINIYATKCLHQNHRARF
jgi:hypothetical protein